MREKYRYRSMVCNHPLEEPALNMLKLEGEFPLAPKTPVNIQLEDCFDQTGMNRCFTAYWTRWQKN